MKSLISKPVITREEFQQGRILVEKLGLLSDLPPDIVQLSSVVKNIIGNTKVVKGIRAGDYNSLIMFSAIYWGIVKTFPKTIIRNVKKFLERFNENASKNSSRELLFIFNFTGTQRTRILASMQKDILGIAKDYGFEEGSHMDYWKELMAHLGIMTDPETGRLSQMGTLLMTKVEKAEPVRAIQAVINKEIDQRNALIGMLAVEFLAIGASEAIIDSPESKVIFDPNGRGVPRTWFDVHYHSGTQHTLIGGRSKLEFNKEIYELQLPHDIITFNMAKIAHSVDHKEEDFQKILRERIFKIASMFAEAGNYMYEMNA
jgi:hypothetical protein